MELDTKIPEEMDSIPPESVLNTDSDGIAVEAAFHNALDDSDDSDPDYTGEVEAQESEEDKGDVEDASSDAPVPKKKKVAGINHSLCQVINGICDCPPTQEINQYKCKVVKNADSDRSVHTASNIKGAKLKSDGLQKDWQKQIVAKTLAHPIINNKDNDSNNNSSKEETQDSELSAIKNTRLSVKTQFKATAINFAANLDQPFSADALLHNHIAFWWDLVYDFTMEEYWAFTTKSSNALPAIVEQVGKVIMGWQSSIRKEAIQILTNIFKMNDMMKDNIVAWVDDQHDAAGYASLATGLSDEKWDAILEAAKACHPLHAVNTVPKDKLRAALSL
ncbi:hypothetical protein H0H87_004045 [Tephrocybe sp. NHM501043]|nr:hypothetical protein H0H87_004045 [Tephrocybe sp. NHM501043]